MPRNALLVAVLAVLLGGCAGAPSASSPATGDGRAAPAPAGGARVTFNSSNSIVAPVPADIVVPEGVNSRVVVNHVATTPVAATTTVTITGTYNGGSRTATLTVTWVDASPPLVLRLADPRRTTLAQTLRERVQSSVVLSETVTFAAGLTARVAVRRGLDGSLFSQVVTEPGVDLRDPEVAARVDAAEDRVRSASGLPL